VFFRGLTAIWRIAQRATCGLSATAKLLVSVAASGEGRKRDGRAFAATAKKANVACE